MTGSTPVPANAVDAGRLTRDSFCHRRLTVYQHKTGYRFSIDSVLLAGFVRPGKGRRLVDLGCGCGIIALLLAGRYADLRMWGVEIQPALAALARRNVTANGMAGRIRILEIDMRALSQSMTGGVVDGACCNPPFGRARSGRINPNTEQALARHEIQISLPALTGVARRILRTGGRFSLIFPADRLTDLLCQMRADNIEPKRLQMVHSYAARPPRRIMVEGVAGARPGTVIDPALVIYRPDGTYTDAVRQLMA